MSLRRSLARIAKGTGLVALALLVAGIGVWGALLLEYAGPRNDVVHKALAIGFSLAALAALIALFVRRWRWRAPRRLMRPLTFRDKFTIGAKRGSLRRTASVAASSEVVQRLFLEYMHRINALRTQPKFYNTLTTNCTTNIWTNDHVNAGRVPLSWKILASGYVPEYRMNRNGRKRGRLGIAATGACQAAPSGMARQHFRRRLERGERGLCEDRHAEHRNTPWRR